MIKAMPRPKSGKAETFGNCYDNKLLRAALAEDKYTVYGLLPPAMIGDWGFDT